MWKRLSLLWAVVRGDARVLWRAAKHPLAPRWLTPALVVLLLYVLSPVDLIPDFIPFVGWVDDLVLVPFALRFLASRLPAGLRDDVVRGRA